MHTNDNTDQFEDQNRGSSGSDTEVALGKGLDVGTANLAAAVQNDEGGITVNVERNAFLDINSDVYSKNMLTLKAAATTQAAYRERWSARRRG